MSSSSLSAIVSTFGKSCKAKLANRAASGAPEDQLRAPLEALFQGLAALAGLPDASVTLVGESTLGALATRPDYAVTVRNALVGFIEVKAPGKGADPRRFTDEHDKKQWAKLKSLPNLLYTDGNSFSLWRDGQLVDKLVELEGDVETAGAKLAAPAMLPSLIADFLGWSPAPPRTVKQLAETSARLCRLLRDEVTEELERKNPGLTELAQEWRGLLFPQYEVSGKNVLRQWFSYRRLDRSRPIIGDRRPPSPLDKIQPEHWPDEYTTDLMNLLHVLGRLVKLEPAQADLLERICAAPLLPAAFTEPETEEA